MDVCVFCGETVVPAAAGDDLVWLDAGGVSTCTADGGTGPHYPGREADLFWRGSEVIDLTGPEPVVELSPGTPDRLSAGRGRISP
jgi:hypothetical protein